jgi:hypothetical protein
MDASTVDVVWADLLYDGIEHDHAAGGLMVHRGAVGTHLPWAAQHGVVVVYGPDGTLAGFDVDLDPLRDEFLHDHLHDGHETVDGWSDPVEVALFSDRAVFGDPVGLPQADGTGGLMDIAWPSPGGVVRVSVLTSSGVRRAMRVTWASRV